MPIHRWRVRYVIGFVIPISVFLSLNCVQLYRLQRSGPEGMLRVVGETPARSIALAENLVACGRYGLRCDSVSPVRRDFLWSLVIALVGGLDGQVLVAARAAAAVSGLVLLWVIWRAARDLFPFLPFVTFSCAAVGLLPGFGSAVSDGSSLLFSSALLCSALCAYWRGMVRETARFSLLPALLIGLSAWIYLPFAAVWVVLALHTLVPLGSPRFSYTQRLLYALEGALLVAVVISPLLFWNARHWQVPWLEEPGALLTASRLQESGGGVMQLWGDAARARYADIVRGWFSSGVLGGVIPPVFSILGLGVLVGLGISSENERHLGLLVVLVFLVLPLVIGIVSPFFAVEDPAEIVMPFAPLVALVAAYGFFRLPFILEGAYRRWKPGLPEGLAFRPWWITAGVLLCLSWIIGGWRQADTGLQQWAEEVQRAKVLEQIVSGTTNRVIGADRPGLIYASGVAAGVVDISGYLDPAFLACSADGMSYWRCILRKLQQAGARFCVLFRPPDQAVDWQQLGWEVETPEGEGGLLVLSLGADGEKNAEGEPDIPPGVLRSEPHSGDSDNQTSGS